jgi:hypothetical protein
VIAWARTPPACSRSPLQRDLADEYSQQTGVPHVMSPKRSRLFTASALTAPRGGFEVEAEQGGRGLAGS